jgi:single-strand DNA-binding protein
MYFNRAIVIGNLTRDPELRALPSGAKVCNFGIATNRVWRDKAGAKQEDTQFHNIVVFGTQADTVAQYLRKGNTALVEGRMQTRTWDSADGKKQSRMEIVAERVQFGPKGGATGGYGGAPSAGPGAGAAAPKEELKTIEYPQDEINPEDIPF